MEKITAGVTALLCLLQFAASAQQTPDSLYCSPLQSLGKISDHALGALNNRYSLLNKLVEKRAEKAIKNMEKKELAMQGELQKQLHGADSIKAAALFSGTKAGYQQMLNNLRVGIQPPALPVADATANPLKQYIPGVDSMQTALRFLSQPGVAIPGQAQKIQVLSQQLQQLQEGLQNANDVQTFISLREQQLKDQLANSGLAKQLLGVNQEAFYYQAQLVQYKGMLNDPDKMQQAVLSAVRQSPYFQNFWQKSSYFASLFPPSPNAGTPLALVGLQTRDQVQQQVQKKLGMSSGAVSGAVSSAAANAGGGGGGFGYLQQQLQNAETKLEAIKNKLAQVGSGDFGAIGGNALSGGMGGGGIGCGSMTMPDFQPNSQHAKTFLKRLEYSFTIQNAASTPLLPAISSLGLNIGYKLSDKAVVGVGSSYLLGLGTGLNHIRFSNQGISYRVFGDIRAKGSIWITGGLEYTFLQQFSSFQDIRNINVWQKSALIGLKKKYRIGRKNGEIQLLYDLLASQEVPNGQALKFRMGWAL